MRNHLVADVVGCRTVFDDPRQRTVAMMASRQFRDAFRRATSSLIRFRRGARKDVLRHNAASLETLEIRSSRQHRHAVIVPLCATTPRLTSLTTLYIGGNFLLPLHVMELPVDLPGVVPALEVLVLHYVSELARVPDSLCDLRCLRELNIMRCQELEDLPERLGDLRGTLETLKCSGSPAVPGLPLGAAGLDELKVLYLRDMDLEVASLPRRSVECLMVEFCDFDDLESLFDLVGTAMPKLRKLSLAGQYELEEVPERVLRNRSLREIDVSYCDGLSRLEGDLSRLELIDAYCCPLEEDFVTAASDAGVELLN